MEPLIIEGTDDTPKVILNKDNNEFEFSGISLPENVTIFYGPVLKWLEEYAKQPNPSSEVSCRFSYFNTATSKILLDILTVFEKVKEQGNKVKISWQYPTDDEDMLDAGKEYADIVSLDFSYVPY
jgi:hypothetical protein